MEEDGKGEAEDEQRERNDVGEDEQVDIDDWEVCPGTEAPSFLLELQEHVVIVVNFMGFFSKGHFFFYDLAFSFYLHHLTSVDVKR